MKKKSEKAFIVFSVFFHLENRRGFWFHEELVFCSVAGEKDEQKK